MAVPVEVILRAFAPNRARDSNPDALRIESPVRRQIFWETTNNRERMEFLEWAVDHWNGMTPESQYYEILSDRRRAFSGR